LQIIKKAVKKCLSRGVLAGPSKRFVFLFHDISDPDATQYSKLYSTPRRVFREQIEFLAKHFDFVPPEEITDTCARVTRRRLASITFDDGFLSVRDQASPFLDAMGIPFGVFVNRTAVEHNRLANGEVGDAHCTEYSEKVFLDEQDIRFLSDRGVLIGSHTSNHKVLSSCSEDELHKEIDENKQYIEGIVGKPVNHLALPYGKREHYNDRVLKFCSAARHEFVYTTNPSFFELGKIGHEPKLIPRLGLTDQSNEELLFLLNRPLIRRIDI